ncbi:MAG: hypothetical protein FJ025_03240 [Chloroflexi bacterium]|nr:hypothetical protein [Chloroflexota bacterium]
MKNKDTTTTSNYFAILTDEDRAKGYSIASHSGSVMLLKWKKPITWFSAHAKWNEYHPNIREYIRTLEPLQLIPMRPLMLAVARRFSKQQAAKAFRQFVCWSVRFLIAGGGRTGATEEALAKAAKEVSESGISVTVPT